MSPALNADGTPREPTTEDRVGWAKAALDAYTRAVDAKPLEAYDGDESLEMAVKDLLADLMHLVSDLEQFMDWADTAARRYKEEVEDDLQYATEVVIHHEEGAP